LDQQSFDLIISHWFVVSCVQYSVLNEVHSSIIYRVAGKMNGPRLQSLVGIGMNTSTEVLGASVQGQSALFSAESATGQTFLKEKQMLRKNGSGERVSRLVSLRKIRNGLRGGHPFWPEVLNVANQMRCFFFERDSLIICWPRT
jgi:hypothetical protein